MAALGSGCQRSGPPEPYVRISGEAPPLTQAPSTSALLLSFWATWCGPCVEETESLRALAEAPPKGLSVVVLSEDDSLDPVQSFFHGAIPEALHLRIDRAGMLADRLGVEQLPTSLLVVNGRLVARFDGQRDWGGRRMRSTLEALMAGSTSRK